MGDLFKSLSAGLGRFVNAWLIPSIVVCGVISFLLLPLWGAPEPELDVLQGALFALTSLTLAVVLAYCSRPLYQFLEGYTMPRWLRKRFLKRMRREYLRLQTMSRVGTSTDRAWSREQLKMFPEDPADLMPTRLGNALKAIETYGDRRLGLDSQTLWYEIQSVAHPDLKRDADESQGSADFFISAIANIGILCVASLATTARALSFHLQAPQYPRIAAALALALISGALVYPAYRQAVNKVAEWRWALQALINTCRPSLAAALSLELPPTFKQERKMWEDVCTMIYYGSDPDTLLSLDRWRVNRSKEVEQPAKHSLHRLVQKFPGRSQ